MPSPVTWYRITNVVVALGFAVAKYTIHGAKVSTLDFAGAVFTGVVLYFIGWWEKHPGLQWYFEPDWQEQRQMMTSCVVKLKDFIRKVTSIYANELICALLLISQFPAILALAGIHPYRGESSTIALLMGVGMGVPFMFPPVWMRFKIKRHDPLTRFERIFLGITAVLWLYIGFWNYAISPFVNGSIHENPLWVNILFALYALLFSLPACSYAASAVGGRVWPRTIELI